MGIRINLGWGEVTWKRPDSGCVESGGECQRQGRGLGALPRSLTAHQRLSPQVWRGALCHRRVHPEGTGGCFWLPAHLRFQCLGFPSRC